MEILPRLLELSLVLVLFASGVFYFIPALVELVGKSWIANNSLASLMMYLLSFGVLVFLISRSGKLMKS